MEAPSTASSAASSVDGRSSGGTTDYLNLGMFSSGPSDLLEGGFSSLNNNNNNTNFGNELTGGTTSFDLSDFPTLGGSGLAALRQQHQQQQQIMAHQQMMQGQGKYRLAMTGNGNFNMASEDFPALSTGSAPNSGVVGPSNGSLLPSSIGRNQSSGLAMYKPEMDGLQLDGASGLLGNTGLGGLGALRGLQQPGSTQHPPMNRSAPSAGAIGSAASVVAGGSALSGDYGLLGLLGVIRMTDADRNALALGSDLTLLGLNLGSTEQIYSTFSGPWSDGAPAKEPHFQLPSCYYMQAPALKTGHLSKFQLETLFYIFYSLPKDVLQAYAAQELYTREWRYHGELKLWFKRDNGSYLYFDINSWERRLFNGSMNQNLGFLSEEEVRVKFPSS
ncbi:CCR4-NOT transcription complex subunit 2 [Fistulifera solaris]|uniref:CCR4-NOT transcription complex subunit 2 n=1 Tax=Fistulifera solaris TaxID=1519565 RepID=A0A1Z5JAB7_FISSO|nr:CCR4-NOT transcription complex subunit 2 [Fistulifera solaris]|eukprot:GAX10842.1 CCR4-NOT transcription complex subunit 2 [Fistulifera solaris]